MSMLPDNLTKFLDKHVWTKRFGLYASILAGITLAFIFIFGLFKLIVHDFSIISNTAFAQYNTTELRNMGFFDNERYFISALVQSLAATIALVITLSLVAVQLAAQSYSARVIDVYKKNPDMWILLSIYITVIFYGLGLLKVIEIGVADINMEFVIFVAYLLGFFAFVCLVPYMLKTLDLLKPSTVIKLLAIDITKKKILKALEKDREIAEKDPVQPIIDIINAALERNDYETVRNGLTAIRKSTVTIIEGIDNKKFEDDKLLPYIVQHIERFGTMAIYRKNDDSTKSAIFNLGIIGIKTTEKGQDFTASNIATTIGNLGIRAMSKELGGTVLETIEALEKIANKAIEKESEWTVKSSIDMIKEMMEKAEESNWKDIMGAAQESLHIISQKSTSLNYS